MRLTKKQVEQRERLAYQLFTTRPDGAPLDVWQALSVKAVQTELRKPENGARMMSPGRIYQIHRAAKAGAGLPAPNDFSKKAK